MLEYSQAQPPSQDRHFKFDSPVNSIFNLLRSDTPTRFQNRSDARSFVEKSFNPRGFRDHAKNDRIMTQAVGASRIGEARFSWRQLMR